MLCKKSHVICYVVMLYQRSRPCSAAFFEETKKPKYAVNPNKYLEDGEAASAAVRVAVEVCFGAIPLAQGSAEGEDDEEEDVPEE